MSTGKKIAVAVAIIWVLGVLSNFWLRGVAEF